MSHAPRNPLAVLFGLTRAERLKALLLSLWFFCLVAALWLLKPIRTASLLAHLGAVELPYVRFASVVVVALVVMLYSLVVNRHSRLNVVRGVSLLFAAALACFWLAMRLGGAAIAENRAFIWAVFVLVDVYSTVMVAMFWTYTNDVVTRAEADKLYGPIGLGGIVGGVAGGLTVDALVASIGPVDLLLVCIALVLAGGGIGWASERLLQPPERQPVPDDGSWLAAALEGGRHVAHSRYLTLLVGVVVCYEFAAALGDFAVNVVFERTFESQVEIAKMFGRLGWIVSGVALVTQLLLVPLLLPFKRIALVVPPAAMAVATLGLAALPVVSLAVVLAASDRGLNYSLQQVTKETLYVPLTDSEKYKAKAFIDVFVDRAAKALSSVALMMVIALAGVSVRLPLLLAAAALGLWLSFASALGRLADGERHRTGAYPAHRPR